MINGDKNHKRSSKNFNNEDLNRPLGLISSVIIFAEEIAFF